jgi:hypothetical protein
VWNGTDSRVVFQLLDPGDITCWKVNSDVDVIVIMRVSSAFDLRILVFYTTCIMWK